MMLVAQQIETLLKEAFSPKQLEVINESHGHNVPKGSETHFKVVMVSDQFKDMPNIKRHRTVIACLKTLLEQSIHALSLHLYTTDEWEKNSQVSDTPSCLGGRSKETSKVQK